MTREEEIIQMSKKTALEDWHEGQAGYFEAKEYLRKGAEWADQHPRKGLVDIEKVEKVLGNLLFNKEEKIYRAYLDYDAFFEDLHKAMEE